MVMSVTVRSRRSLRGIRITAPFTRWLIATLEDTIEFQRRPRDALDDAEKRDLLAFLRAL
jgi:hypothetical protein